MKLQDHERIKISWSQLFAGPSSEDTIVGDIKVIKQPNNQDYLEVTPKGRSPGGDVLISEDCSLIPNLCRTLKLFRGKTKREIGSIQINDDMTVAKP